MIEYVNGSSCRTTIVGLSQGQKVWGVLKSTVRIRQGFNVRGVKYVINSNKAWIADLYDGCANVSMV